MKALTRPNQEQNYLFLPAVLLKIWFEKMHQAQFGALVAQPKALPAAEQPEEKLEINFSDWDMPQSKPELLIEEYLWGIRYGVMQYMDVERCSFSEVLEIAKTDDMCEIYSPAKVQYFSDGSRKVISQDVAVYNTDAKFGCWSLINLKQAKTLFPQYAKIFDKLPKETKFLCSPEVDKLRIVNQGHKEIGFSFSLVDTSIQDVAFYLGYLRPSFRYIAQEIEQGRGLAFCNPHQMNDLDYLKSKICLMSGGQYPYSLAQNLVSESSYRQMQSSYLQEGIKGKDIFRILIDGSYLKEDDDFNKLVVKDGADIKLCVSPSVYKRWGRPFSPSELEIINRLRNFDFDAQAENDYYSKINRLRFSQREINIFAESKPKQKIIEVEPLQEIITHQMDEIANVEQALAEQAKRVEEERQREEKLRRQEAFFASRDLSGPTRSSLYTGF